MKDCGSIHRESGSANTQTVSVRVGCAGTVQLATGQLAGSSSGQSSAGIALMATPMVKPAFEACYIR